MPTDTEIEELVKKCTWEWISNNAYKGYKVTGPNGYSIFLPAAGFCNDTEYYNVDNNGSYWSSTLYGWTNLACYLKFTATQIKNTAEIRMEGRSVRPVTN